MLELAQMIVEYDIDYNEYDDTVFKVAKDLESPSKVAEMIQKYTDDLAFHKAIAEDFQSFTPRTRSVSEGNVNKLNKIIKRLEGLLNA